jgi:hypothetical protein
MWESIYYLVCVSIDKVVVHFIHTNYEIYRKPTCKLIIVKDGMSLVSISEGYNKKKFKPLNWKDNPI